MTNSFPCTQCGACCTAVGYVRDFPEPVLPNGHCAHLGRDNRCVVYHSRPDVCRIKPGTHAANARACSDLQDLLQIRYRRPSLARAVANDYLYQKSRLAR